MNASDIIYKQWKQAENVQVLFTQNASNWVIMRLRNVEHHIIRIFNQARINLDNEINQNSKSELSTEIIGSMQ
jgi:hypothetical protein